MTIHLPEDLASWIRAEVLSGHFASEDDMVAAAVRDFLQRQQQASPPTSQEPSARQHKPIWEEFEEIAASIPDEVWSKLAVDGAEQHDHYIYDTPKRPPSP
jgi:Arc/MetJ-type ribon-helix-helix transcriptional regulator